MSFVKILFCAMVVFHGTTAHDDLSLCSQVYQMNEYCTRGQHLTASSASTASIVKIGKAGPRGPPGRSSSVDYELINTKMLDMVRGHVNELKTEQADDIRQLKIEMKNLKRRFILLTDWKGTSDSDLFFKIFRTKVDYATAKSNCEKEGAILASKSIRNPVTYREIFAEVKKVGSDAWIGLDDIQVEGRWVWADGTVGAINNLLWGSTQPDNNGGNEDCIHFSSYKDVYNFNDLYCSKLFMYVCEKTF